RARARWQLELFARGRGRRGIGRIARRPGVVGAGAGRVAILPTRGGGRRPGCGRRRGPAPVGDAGLAVVRVLGARTAGRGGEDGGQPERGHAAWMDESMQTTQFHARTVLQEARRGVGARDLYRGRIISSLISHSRRADSGSIECEATSDGMLSAVSGLGSSSTGETSLSFR